MRFRRKRHIRIHEPPESSRIVRDRPKVRLARYTASFGADKTNPSDQTPNPGDRGRLLCPSNKGSWDGGVRPRAWQWSRNVTRGHSISHQGFNVYNFLVKKGAQCTILRQDRTLSRFFIHEIVHTKNRLKVRGALARAATFSEAVPAVLAAVPAVLAAPAFRHSMQAGTTRRAGCRSRRRPHPQVLSRTKRRPPGNNPERPTALTQPMLPGASTRPSRVAGA